MPRERRGGSIPLSPTSANAQRCGSRAWREAASPDVSSRPCWVCAGSQHVGWPRRAPDRGDAAPTSKMTVWRRISPWDPPSARSPTLARSEISHVSSAQRPLYRPSCCSEHHSMRPRGRSVPGSPRGGGARRYSRAARPRSRRAPRAPRPGSRRHPRVGGRQPPGSTATAHRPTAPARPILPGRCRPPSPRAQSPRSCLRSRSRPNA